MEQRVDVIMGNGTRRRAKVAVDSHGQAVLSISGVELTPADHAMQGACVVCGDDAMIKSLLLSGFCAERAGGVTVAAKLPRDVHRAMQAASTAAGMSMSAALTAAARAWLAAGCPASCNNNAPDKGSGQRG